MSVSIDWGTKIITIPQAFLTFVGGSVYELDLDEFRLALKSLEDSEEGIMFPDTHIHNTEVVLGGVTYARFIEITDYTITFEDGMYIVNIVGGNNNILDKMNLNYVSVRSSNSAGLIVSGSGVTEQDKTDISTKVWETRGVKVDRIFTELHVVQHILQGKWEIDEILCRMHYYELYSEIPIISFQLLDKNGDPSTKEVYSRVPI